MLPLAEYRNLAIDRLKKCKVLNDRLKEEIEGLDSNSAIKALVKRIIRVKHKILNVYKLARDQNIKIDYDLPHLFFEIDHIDPDELHKVYKQLTGAKKRLEKEKKKRAKKERRILVGENFKPPRSIENLTSSIKEWTHCKACESSKPNASGSVYKIIFVGRMYY